MVLFTLGAAAQISVQVYSVNAPWNGKCEEGLRVLAQSVQNAQRASDKSDLPPEEALRRFRHELAPAWGARDTIERMCMAAGDPQLLETLSAIERLRYAEENSMRRDGHDLVPLRRRVQGLLEKLPP